MDCILNFMVHLYVQLVQKHRFIIHASFWFRPYLQFSVLFEFFHFDEFLGSFSSLLGLSDSLRKRHIEPLLGSGAKFET